MQHVSSQHVVGTMRVSCPSRTVFPVIASSTTTKPAPRLLVTTCNRALAVHGMYSVSASTLDVCICHHVHHMCFQPPVHAQARALHEGWGYVQLHSRTLLTHPALCLKISSQCASTSFSRKPCCSTGQPCLCPGLCCAYVCVCVMFVCGVFVCERERDWCA